MPTDDLPDRIRKTTVPPTRAVDPDALWDLARHRRRRRRIGVGLTAVAVLIAGGVAALMATAGSDPHVQAGVADAGPDESGPADGCAMSIDELLDPATDVLVYLQPDATSAQIADKVAELRADPDVRSVVVVDQDTQYEQFRVLFADQPDVIASVTPDILPTLLEVDITGGEVAITDFVIGQKIAKEQDTSFGGDGNSVVREVMRRSDAAAAIGPCASSPGPTLTDPTTTAPSTVGSGADSSSSTTTQPLDSVDWSQVTYPFDCGTYPGAGPVGWHVWDVQYAHPAGGVEMAVVLVTCDAGAGSPPAALLVYDGAASPSGDPHLTQTLVSPEDNWVAGDVSPIDDTVSLPVSGYTTADVPHCCPDVAATLVWHWVDGSYQPDGLEPAHHRAG